MDPILSEVYSTVLPAAPYVLAAYIGIWLVLFIFVLVLWRKSKHTSEDIEALKQALEDRKTASASTASVNNSKSAGRVPHGDLRGRRFYIKCVDDERIWTMNC